ncbi:MAG: 2-dehydro-3-deoxygalactonokinase [Gammaproteobacteria bacterium]|nr:2-dehydro-3-deoxygalactonokinase [Gammaproteobacteria bacterium]
MKGPFIAVDWGTTNRRAYRIENGRATHVERSDRGILAVHRDEFAGEAAALRSRWGDLPLLCVGMVGSRRGWREIPYVPTPASLSNLALGTIWVERDSVAITPGVSQLSPDRCDVMRGEEVQFLGAVAAGVAPAERLLCQPGTHSKWARVQAARIQDFSTAMTGELYSLLRQHSLLAEMLEGEAVIGPAFHDGVREGCKQTLLSSLFGARAAQLLNVRPAGDGASFVSGLLIASDVRSQLRGVNDDVYVIGDAPLGPLYAAAIAALGGRPHLIDSTAAFVAGVSNIWEVLR